MPLTPDMPPGEAVPPGSPPARRPLPAVAFDLARVPEVPLDGLLRRAAAAAPDRVAVRTPAGTTTYAELDGLADSCARALTGAAGRSATVVGLAASLDPSFAVVYYGAIRAGHVVALVNPHLRGDALAHVLSAAGVTVAVAPPEVAERIAQVRGRLPNLRDVLSPDAFATGSAASGRGAPGRGLPVEGLSVEGRLPTAGPPTGDRPTNMARSCVRTRWRVSSSPVGPPGNPRPSS
ncbi:hypothetical protein SHKM778_47440 [Streptomyces sp. KM77-8]|uniref:AMP-dependent synthetase/ligase domain-containing protein n=1 Tax=Streptomyces haneummycinicus TaxID=3074435 RepID=A0AAT9HLG5_9ACTN